MRIKIIFAIFVMFAVTVISPRVQAHPMGPQWFGQRSLLTIYPDHIQLDYVVEIPMQNLARKITDYKENEGIKEFTVSDSERFNTMVLSGLKENLKLYFNGVRQGWQHDPGFKDNAGEGEKSFFEFRLKLYAYIPDTREGKIQNLEIVNENYENDKAVYLNGLIAREGVRIENANIPEKMTWIEDYAYRRLKVDFVVDSSWQKITRLGSAFEEDPGIEKKIQNKFAEFLYQKDFTLSFLLIALGTAFVLGAAHAFSPGHGKALVSAYLIGSKGSYFHAILLGVVVTITHTGSVLLLGLLFLAFAEKLMPEKVLPYIGMASGFLILLIGLYTFVARLRENFGGHTHGDHEHHHHHHGRSHGHTHNHPVPSSGRSIKSLFALGVSGGMVPCPSALAVMLIAISINRVLWGMIIILIYSLGLAVVLIVLGCLAVGAADIFKRFEPKGRLLKVLPVFSSIIVVIIGLLIIFSTFKAL